MDTTERSPVRSVTQIEETAGAPVHCGSIPMTETPCRSRSSRAASASGCRPRSVTSVASPPSSAKVAAALAAGPPAATSWLSAVTFSFGPGATATRYTQSRVASPTKTPRRGPPAPVTTASARQSGSALRVRFRVKPDDPEAGRCIRSLEAPPPSTPDRLSRRRSHEHRHQPRAGVDRHSARGAGRGPAQGLRQRRHQGRRARRGVGRVPHRRVHRDHGPVRLGQVDADALPGRRWTPPTSGQVFVGDAGPDRAEGQGADPAAARPDRLRLPGVQPGADADRAGEHHAADGHRRPQARPGVAATP